MSKTMTRITAGDAVWIATALLHRENPSRQEFTIPEIKERTLSEELWDGDERTIYQHVLQHCVANRPPRDSKLRMLYDTRPGQDRPGYRRLFREGDDCDPARQGNKSGMRITPLMEDLPEEYIPLLNWYAEWNGHNRSRKRILDPLLALYGSGKEIWADEHADEYVARLREGWE
jgi:hypothetical protein